MTASFATDKTGVGSSPLRVLVVEDDPLVCAMLVSVLNHVGIQAVQAVGAKREALDAIGSDALLDLAFVDINLDVAAGGVEVAKAAAQRGLYVVIITGDHRVPSDLAGHALLLKPFSVDQLETIVGQARRHFRR
jgi:CheY-like chemotaxis protein